MKTKKRNMITSLKNMILYDASESFSSSLYLFSIRGGYSCVPFSSVSLPFLTFNL